MESEGTVSRNDLDYNHNTLYLAVTNITSQITHLVKVGNALTLDNHTYIFPVAAYLSTDQPLVLAPTISGSDIYCIIPALSPNTDPVNLFVGRIKVTFSNPPTSTPKAYVQYSDTTIDPSQVPYSLLIDFRKYDDPPPPLHPILCNFQLPYNYEIPSYLFTFPIVSVTYQALPLPHFNIDVVITAGSLESPYCEVSDTLMPLNGKVTLPIRIFISTTREGVSKIFRTTISLSGDKYRDVKYIFLYYSDEGGTSRGTVYAPQKPPGDSEV